MTELDRIDQICVAQEVLHDLPRADIPQTNDIIAVRSPSDPRATPRNDIATIGAEVDTIDVIAMSHKHA